MRLIDADRAKKDFNLNFGGVSHAVIANRILDEQPTIDAVPVVRCRECEHLDRAIFVCTEFDAEVGANHFCSLGKKEG